MKNNNYTINIEPKSLDTIIGNYHMYRSDVYDALERLQQYLDDSHVKAVLESEDPEIQERLSEECLHTDFISFLEDIKEAMGY
jgi:hypothetical protein